MLSQTASHTASVVRHENSQLGPFVWCLPFNFTSVLTDSAMPDTSTQAEQREWGPRHAAGWKDATVSKKK